jgi:hypothetical protein
VGGLWGGYSPKYQNLTIYKKQHNLVKFSLFGCIPFLPLPYPIKLLKGSAVRVAADFYTGQHNLERIPESVKRFANRAVLSEFNDLPVSQTKLVKFRWPVFRVPEPTRRARLTHFQGRSVGTRSYPQETCIVSGTWFWDTGLSTGNLTKLVANYLRDLGRITSLCD